MSAPIKLKLQNTNHKLQINIKLQCPPVPVRSGTGLFGGNDQNQTSANSVEPFVWNFVLVYFYWYLEFIIWCLTGILKNFIKKYFAKNDQKTFIKELLYLRITDVKVIVNEKMSVKVSLRILPLLRSVNAFLCVPCGFA